MTTRIEILAMIGSALNRPERTPHYYDRFEAAEATPQRDGIIIKMNDGSRFRIVPEAV